MNEQFDRALRNHIRDTFDHYDDLMADDGWKKFNKQKNKKKRGLIFWYGFPSGIAAALALLWVFNLTTVDLVKPKNETVTQNKTHKTPELTTERPKAIDENNSIGLEQEKAKAVVKINRNIAKQNSTSPQKVENIEPITKTTIYRQEIALINTPLNELNKVESSDERLSASFNDNDFNQIASTAPASDMNNKEDLTFNNSLLANAANYKPALVPEKKKTEKVKSSAFKFSVDANTFYSFTTAGVTDDLNLGLGILSELKITKRLSVNSGISLNRQTTNYVAVANTASTGMLSSFASKQPVSVPDEVETSAKLVGFEIPLNLKYNVAIGKLKTFFTSGISSYSLLNQSYTNDLSVISYSLNSAPTTSTVRDIDKKTEGAFSTCQFARTVNFSFGILYPVSTKNSISVEPFLRYPISGFGSQNLEIGAGGVSFKLNFGR